MAEARGVAIVVATDSVTLRTQNGFCFRRCWSRVCHCHRISFMGSCIVEIFRGLSFIKEPSVHASTNNESLGKGSQRSQVAFQMLS